MRLLSRMGRPILTPHLRKSTKTSIIVDWFAIYFARSASGDAVATAVQCEPGQITLHVALDRLPTTEDHDAAGNLLSALRDVLGRKRTFRGRTLLLRRLIARQTPARIRRKLERLVSAEEYRNTRAVSLGVMGAFDQALSCWESLCKKEMSPQCLDASERLYGDREHGIGVIRAKFGQLLEYVQDALNIADPESTPDQWFNALENVWGCLHIIHFSDFLGDFEKVDVGAFMAHFHFMKKLRLRMWHIFSYSFGAAWLVSDGIPLFRQTLGDWGIDCFVQGDGGVSIRWIDESASSIALRGEPFHFPTTPAVHLDNFIESCALRARYRPGIRSVLQQQDCVANAWSPDDVVVPKVHSELRLVTYLVRESIDVIGDCIGMSKPACWACECYLGIPRPRSRRSKWRFSESSGKLRDDWMPPPTTEGEKTADLLARQFAARIASELDPVLIRTDRVYVQHYRNDHFDNCPELKKMPPGAIVSGFLFLF